MSHSTLGLQCLPQGFTHDQEQITQVRNGSLDLPYPSAQLRGPGREIRQGRSLGTSAWERGDLGEDVNCTIQMVEMLRESRGVTPCSLRETLPDST